MRMRRRRGSATPFTYDASATGAFRAVAEGSPSEAAPPAAALRGVVVGGGTGAPVSIRTLVNLGAETSAVVAMADDGGSTGILREEAGVTPPGDVRKCLSAFARDADDPLALAFRSRFSFADNHTLGNLMLSALEDVTGSFPEAIRICERLLHAQGRVLPSTLARVTLIALTRDGRRIDGQAVASHSRSALERVALESSGPIVAYAPAVEALRSADIVVLGPGSLFTSIIPNLLVPGIADAIRSSRAQVVFVCSLADMQGETRGMTALEHYDALCAHGMDGRIDCMLVHRPAQGEPGAFGDDADEGAGDDGARPIRLVRATDEDVRAVEARGTHVVMRDFADPTYPTWHEPHALHEAFREVVRACRSRRR